MSRRQLTIIGTCIAIAGAISFCALTGGCDHGPPSVRVDGQRLTVEEVLAEVARHSSDHASASAAVAAPADPREQALAALHRLVIRAVVTAAPMSEEEAELLRTHQAHRLVQQCVAVRTKRLLAERFDLDQEMRARFAADPGRYTSPESFRLQMIFIPSDEPEGEQLASDLLARLQRAPDMFDELARQHSRSATAADGGTTRPMPGSAVHPEMRAAVHRHRDDDEVFLVTLDRGWYLARTLEYWPAPEADYASALPQLRTGVGRELVAELHAELRERAHEEHEIRVLDQALAAPELAPSTAVYELDGHQLRVGALVPEVVHQGPAPAGLVRRQLEAYRSWREPALVLGCEPPLDPEIPDDALLSLRLPPMLRDYVASELSNELEHFVNLHRQVLVREPGLVLDLWIMPFGDDPYQAHRALQELLATAGSEIGDAEATAATQAGGQLHRDLHVDASQLDQYEPRLYAVLAGAEPGATFPILRSSRNRAFLAVRLREREPGRPLELDDAEDRAMIVRRYLDSSSDQALTLMAEHHLGDRVVRDRLLDACARALAAELPADDDHGAAAGGSS